MDHEKRTKDILISKELPKKVPKRVQDKTHVHAFDHTFWKIIALEKFLYESKYEQDSFFKSG
jgi:hypothetical protein